jgi:DNA-binding transcriptional ArsR family regulator
MNAEEQNPVQAYYKAMSHPTRRQILLALRSRKDPLSPSAIARASVDHVSQTSYHFRVLLECGLVELVDTRAVRGSMEHLYRAAAAFTPDLVDRAALDRLAELLADGGVVEPAELKTIVSATGRPVS